MPFPCWCQSHWVPQTLCIHIPTRLRTPLFCLPIPPPKSRNLPAVPPGILSPGSAKPPHPASDVPAPRSSSDVCVSQRMWPLPKSSHMGEFPQGPCTLGPEVGWHPHSSLWFFNLSASFIPKSPKLSSDLGPTPLIAAIPCGLQAVPLSPDSCSSWFTIALSSNP